MSPESKSENASLSRAVSVERVAIVVGAAEDIGRSTVANMNDATI